MRKISLVTFILGLTLISGLAYAVFLDIKVLPGEVFILPGNFDYATADVSPNGVYNLTILDTICKDTNNDGDCEAILTNDPSNVGEAQVVFKNNGLLSITSDSLGKADIKITLGSGATLGARYIYLVSTTKGLWAEAYATAEGTAIPEFSNLAVPVLLTIMSLGLIFKRRF